MTLCAFGMNLHAATTADGHDRKQLERICRYLLRPPFAHDAVTALPGGRVRVSFDVFTLPRPAAVLAAPLGPLAVHFVMRALPLGPTTVPKFPDRGLRRSSSGRSILTSPQIPALNRLSAPDLDEDCLIAAAAECIRAEAEESFAALNPPIKPDTPLRNSWNATEDQRRAAARPAAPRGGGSI